MFGFNKNKVAPIVSNYTTKPTSKSNSIKIEIEDVDSADPYQIKAKS
jgi:hypothetical protein